MYEGISIGQEHLRAKITAQPISSVTESGQTGILIFFQATQLSRQEGKGPYATKI